MKKIKIGTNFGEVLQRELLKRNKGGNMNGIKNPNPKCIFCETEDDLEYGPDPYASEICNNETDVWECHECRYQSAMDI